ncbi:hypothetical protein ACERZ8_13115 [Tateyamaria armeniaca]|uniref:SnoaL-like domain-containing protein n=1 Tax=Tateyamaria armeniaca TaxID=2518930 RepID=A0ABW8UUF8_9RHOB
MTDETLNVFDPGMPDNCDTDDRLGLYRAEAGVPASAVLGWTGPFAGPPDFSQAGALRATSVEEAAEADAYRETFRAQYQSAFGTAFDPDQSPIGEITTLADARILADVPIEGGVLRLSEWERISVAQHIYRHFVVDVIRDGEVVQTFQFSRFQGFLG